jgi:hypothetical protein
MIRLKNILAENMLRFGPKNLSESEKRNLRRLTEDVTLKVTALKDYPAAYKHFAASINKDITTSAPYIGTETIWIATQNQKNESQMWLDIFKPQTISIQGFQFIIPTAIVADDNMILTTIVAQRQQGQGIWQTDTTTLNLSVPDQSDFDGTGGTTVQYDIDNQYNRFVEFGGTAVDMTAFLQKNPSKFNFATIKGQANFATVTAALKNSIAKEVAKTIAA